MTYAETREKFSFFHTLKVGDYVKYRKANKQYEDDCIVEEVHDDGTVTLGCKPCAALDEYEQGSAGETPVVVGAPGWCALC